MNTEMLLSTVLFRDHCASFLLKEQAVIYFNIKPVGLGKNFFKGFSWRPEVPFNVFRNARALLLCKIEFCSAALEWEKAHCACNSVKLILLALVLLCTMFLL